MSLPAASSNNYKTSLHHFATHFATPAMLARRPKPPLIRHYHMMNKHLRGSSPLILFSHRVSVTIFIVLLLYNMQSKWAPFSTSPVPTHTFREEKNQSTQLTKIHHGRNVPLFHFGPLTKCPQIEKYGPGHVANFTRLSMRPGISISTNPKTSESQKWAESTLYARNLQVNCTDHQSKTAKHSGRPNTHVASPIYSSVWVS